MKVQEANLFGSIALQVIFEIVKLKGLQALGLKVEAV